MPVGQVINWDDSAHKLAEIINYFFFETTFFFIITVLDKMAVS